MREITPRQFSLEQRLHYFAGLFVLWGIWTAALVCLWSVSFWLLIFGFILLAITASSVRSFIVGTHGFVAKPRQPWHLSIADDSLHIQTGRTGTRLQFCEIASVTVSLNVSWDVGSHAERESMLLKLLGGGDIRIPGSSIEFESVREMLRGRFGIDTKIFDHDENAYF